MRFPPRLRVRAGLSGIRLLGLLRRAPADRGRLRQRGEQCADAGWDYSSADDSCGVLLTLAGGRFRTSAIFPANPSRQCAAVFGAELNFFSPTIEAGATLRFVYNCDPEGRTGFLPSTLANGATECACPAGKHAHDGYARSRTGG